MGLTGSAKEYTSLRSSRFRPSRTDVLFAARAGAPSYAATASKTQCRFDTLSLLYTLKVTLWCFFKNFFKFLKKIFLRAENAWFFNDFYFWRRALHLGRDPEKASIGTKKGQIREIVGAKKGAADRMCAAAGTSLSRRIRIASDHAGGG
jgi:hypothetical protein